ncbi:RPM1-interacting protein 4 (RIN4) family protein [Medicago truncatula]|uniref:RPM1-interacting protein 4 (RIN4) family protein n=1 Tax=Medicago truncatula TaxID=3880 RepID=G7JAA6_MEDTR|nr:RPM1-interacting protein 4 (RIN4) family protein [Medicago truncatula]
MQKNAPYQSLPQFEKWIQKPPFSDSSMYNSKIKKTKKPNRGASLGNEEEFKVHIMKNKKTEETNISKKRRNLLKYFSCCIKF